MYRAYGYYFEGNATRTMIQKHYIMKTGSTNNKHINEKVAPPPSLSAATTAPAGPYGANGSEVDTERVVAGAVEMCWVQQGR